MAERINPKTAQKLSEQTPVGARHSTAMGIALDLLGNGFPAAAVFETLRAKFDLSVTDKELHDAIGWAQDRYPSPSISRGNGHVARALPAGKAKSPTEHARWWLSDRIMEQAEFCDLSQLPVSENRKHQLCDVLELLYEGAEYLNVVTQFIESNGKANPQGAGVTMTRDDWLARISSKGVPESKAGAWFRPNPCAEKGSGANGAITDSDIMDHRFLLLESDVLALEQQLMLLSKLKLPISLVLLSGGLSAHAWVRLGAKNANDYAQLARRVISALAPFGIDQANKNPSRLSRLPGAIRMIGAKVADGFQKVLWLNPGRPDLTEADLELFEAAMEFPALDEKPFKRIVHEALARYEQLHANRGKSGVPTGFADFDRDTGGLKPCQMTVISAETGSGKSTVAINMATAALLSGKAVAMFTLEMSNADIADLLFAMNCKIERDKFNTGEFGQDDMQMMVSQCQMLSSLPFWCCDDSLLTASQIRKRVLQLKREANIELVIVDYAQIVWADERDIPREQQVAEIARSLRSMAKDAKVPVVVLSQLNDEGRLRESRVIGHEAHNVVFLENKEGSNKIVFHVRKGRTIRKKSYILHYRPEYGLVRSESRHEDVPRIATPPQQTADASQAALPYRDA